MSAAPQADPGRTDPASDRIADRIRELAAGPAQEKRATAAEIWQAEQLGDLRRMREIGMNFVERLERRASGLLLEREERAFLDAGDICLGFARVTRAVRQIIVLEQEMLGLREPPVARAVGRNSAAHSTESAAPPAADPVGDRTDPPDTDRERNDLNDLDDYDRGPADAVVAQIRSTLGLAEAPPPPAPPARGGVINRACASSPPPRRQRRLFASRSKRPPVAAGGGREEGAGTALEKTATAISGGWETARPVQVSAWLAAHHGREDEFFPGPDPP